MKSSARNIELKSVDDLFATEESRADAQREKVQNIPLEELHPFKNHPFKIKNDAAMQDTVDSVREYGVLVPAIARPDPDGGYELIAGHRRHHASELAGKETMPVIVRDLDDDAATIIMVDSNLQREELLPSERAFAYKMKLDAMKRQAGRPSREEIVMWSSWEFKFIELDDSYSTGSSIMPQKKNPDMAELIRGKTGRVYGDLTTILVMLKGIPLAYNKDMQEDKEAIFDAADTVKMCLSVMTPMLETMRVLPDNMKNAAARGFINATDLADYLTKRGVAFRTAYKIVGQLVAKCIAEGEVLETLPLEAYREYSDVFDSDLYGEISLESCVMKRNSAGGTCPDEVIRQAEYIESVLGIN